MDRSTRRQRQKARLRLQRRLAAGAGLALAVGGVTHAAAAAVGNQVYVIGGCGDAPDTPTDRILSVDVAQGRIAPVGRLPEPLSDAAAATVGHRILVAGGRDQGAPQSKPLGPRPDRLTARSP